MIELRKWKLWPECLPNVAKPLSIHLKRFNAVDRTEAP